VFEVKLATAKSCLPSLLKSPIATETGPEPTPTLVAPLKPPAPSPKRIVTEFEPWLATAISCLPSLLYAALGRLRLQLDDDQSARAAFARAAAIIDTIAAGVNDKRLRSKFLNSETVREVLEGIHR
jgi:hypothetical protein